MKSVIARLALPLALAPSFASAAPAAVPRDPLADYVRARAADNLGELDVAARGFADALAQRPGDTRLALRAFRQAVAAGDMPLAVRTARTLDAAHMLPPDGTLLLLTDAVSMRDWKHAQAYADRVADEKLFAFLAPTIRAWIAFGAMRGDPAKMLDAAQPSALAVAYASEHRALLLLAGREPLQGVAALDALRLPDGARAARLHIAAAARLADVGKRDAALAQLTGESPAIRRARELVEAGRPLPGAIDSAQTGMAELLVRVATDVAREQAGALAIAFARMAASLAPANSETWLVTAALLGSAGGTDAAIEALGHIPANDPFAAAARDARLTLLARAGRTEQALAEAKAATTESGTGAADWARYGDLLSANTRYPEASAAYTRALALAGGDAAAPGVAWPILIQQANALLQAGDWPQARGFAQRALALAPEQPAVLNFLGYSELEHGGDSATAGAMIAKASALAPDDASITDSLGWSWYLRGDLTKAIPLLEKAARGAPAQTDINDHLGDAYWRAGRRFEARYAWRAALVAADTKDGPRIRAKIDGGTPTRP